MLTFLKGISSKVYIGIILALLVVSWILFKAYTGGLTENGSLQNSNVTLQQNVEHVEKSAAISDTVVTEFVNEVKQSQQTTERIRKETVNEYINKIKPKVDVVKPTETNDLPDGADRVIGLANSMHENYCRARPKDPRCTPVNIGK